MPKLPLDALSRAVYSAAGTSTLPGILVCSEGDPPAGDADVNAAYDFSGDTDNYYLTQHGRDSYDGAGATIISTTHYCPTNNNCNYQNAFWSGIQMVYGNGFSTATTSMRAFRAALLLHHGGIRDLKRGVASCRPRPWGSASERVPHT